MSAEKRFHIELLRLDDNNAIVAITIYFSLGEHTGVQWCCTNGRRHQGQAENPSLYVGPSSERSSVKQLHALRRQSLAFPVLVKSSEICLGVVHRSCLARTIPREPNTYAPGCGPLQFLSLSSFRLATIRWPVYYRLTEGLLSESSGVSYPVASRRYGFNAQFSIASNPVGPLCENQHSP